MAFQTNDPPVIPDKDCTVKHDWNGADTEYQLFAGQPVPPWLVDDYNEQHGEDKPSKKGSK